MNFSIKFSALRSFGLLALFVCSSLFSFSQDTSPLKFTYKVERLNDKEVVFSIEGKIPSGVKLYALQKHPDEIMYSTIQFDPAIKNHLLDSIFQKENILTETDAALESEVRFLIDSVKWQQKLSASPSDSFAIEGTLSYMYKQGGEFIPKEVKFKEYVLPDASSKTNKSGVSSNADEEEGGSVATRGMWWIFLAGFGGGLLALITPCVFSMIPVTVSFFIKRSKTKAEGIKNAFLYSTSIVVIFTLLGFLITVIFGPTALNNLATNWIANFIFFLVFLVFGISFLGAFEIKLPSSWGNKADSKAGTTNFLGIFFMALTLVVVSFSCTGPIIGNLLVIAARGNYYGPLLGMFGFSLALALPFAFFAFFPGKMNMLGKAGGWLNSVKVTLGFLELALALKFLSNADLVKGWRLLDREIFIVLWVVIFILLGFYLLGKLKFHHDDELPKNDFDIPFISIPRLFLSITSFAFALYMIPGLWGAPLKKISAFLPPMGTQDFTMSAGAAHSQPPSEAEGGLPKPVKYYERMRIFEPEVVTKYHMTTYFDYEEALEVARKLKKPLMLDFTGINCVNCRAMEGQVWSDPEVMQRLKDNFVIASLYVDVHEGVDLQPSEQYESKALGKKITDLGDKNADLQVSVFNANVQPYYFFLDENEKRLMPEGYGYNNNIEKFKNMLDEVVERYNKTK